MLDYHTQSIREKQKYLTIIIPFPLTPISLIRVHSLLRMHTLLVLLGLLHHFLL